MLTIEEKFSQIFKHLGIPKEQIRMETSFIDDFEFNEFQFTCLALYIGVYFKINISEKDYAELKTVGNMFEIVRKKLEVQRSP